MLTLGVRSRSWLEIPELHLATTRYNSFAPIRENVAASYFINARPYFAALAASLRAATRSALGPYFVTDSTSSHIYIADWFLSPYVYLVRGEQLSIDDRLDSILKKKAEEGVKVRVILWDETNLAFPLLSEKAKEILEGLHPNILVIRHPKVTLFWLCWLHHSLAVPSTCQ